MDERMIEILFKNHTFNTIYMQRFIWDFLPEYDDSLVGVQNYVLVVLSKIGECTVKEMADILGRKENTMTKILNKLEKLELIQRRHSTKDRRVIYIALTDKCKELDSFIPRETLRKLKEDKYGIDNGLSEDDYEKLCECILTMSALQNKQR